MDSVESERNYCRICLKNCVFFDWSEQIFEFYGPTYQDCYYKFTEFQGKEDELSQMLCLECGNSLRDTHQLVEKALKFTGINTITNGKKCRICLKKEVFFEGTEAIFEFYGPSYKECYYQYTQQLEEENACDMFCLDCGNTLRNTHQLMEKAFKSYEILQLGVDAIKQAITNNSQEELPEQQEHKVKTKKKRKGQPRMCSYCSHISYSLHHHLKHERIHTRTERNVECLKCGLKFYCKETLNSHMLIHEENRQRKYTCKFCPKAFYTPSGLKYHIRKHLGECVKCQFCSKTYYRQIDLDRHMSRHNAVPINKDNVRPLTKNKTYKKCNLCGKTINRDNFRDHMEKHSNQPKVECNICNKTYFTRNSILRHLREIHNIINADEYNNYIKTFERKYKPRQSTLMKQQNIDID